MPKIEDLNKEEKRSINMSKGDVHALVEPVKSFEITGLVVEEYDSENWLDYAHKHDPFNTRDLCLIWGENAKNDAYFDYKFWHGEFTCFAKPKTRNPKKGFLYQNVSNNHLLPASEDIYKAIKQTKISDQVKFSGSLVNYKILTSEFVTGYRNSSIDPFDNHCEVIYVTEYEILKVGNKNVSLAFEIFKYSLVSSFLLIILIFFIEMQLKLYQANKHE
ncbi:MAG: hypothetical protein ACTSXL_04450 [Alphaproteobacteria bacterium]